MTEHFDVVVVGAGSAGCVVASRLSQDPSRRVLLVEDGPDQHHADLPAGVHGPDFLEAMTAPGRLWPGISASRAAGQGAQPYARGRGVGGSSAVNAMVALAGEPDDYDRWSGQGAHGWSWHDVSPTFEQLRATLPLETVDRQQWGPVDRAFDAAHRRGLEPAVLTMRDGYRASVAEAYVDAARGRDNFVVHGDAAVQRVELDGARAVGIRLASGEVVEAGEVVVCAGAIHSPALLQRSGVCRSSLGRHLKDHPSVRLSLVLNDDARLPAGRPVVSSLARLSSGELANDLQVLPLGRVGAGADGARVATVMMALMQVHSEGTVQALGPDPHQAPRVDLNMLSDERDRRRMRIGLLYLLGLAQHPDVASIASAVVLDQRGTTIEELLGASDEVLDAWILGNLADYVHVAGSCRMGSADDADAVVDPTARVIGYEKLRVCDASIFPDLPRANLHLPVVMVAERVAEMMRAGR